MTFGNLITLIFVIGFGYMMFKGGGCCGSHGGHKNPHGEGDDKSIRPGVDSDEKQSENH